MSDQLSDIDLKEKELAKAKERINNFEDVISAKEAEIESLKTVLSESADHSKFIDLKTSYEQLKNDLNFVLEAKTVLENEISEKNSSIVNLQQHVNSKSTEAGNLETELAQLQQTINESTMKISELENIIET